MQLEVTTISQDWPLPACVETIGQGAHQCAKSFQGFAFDGFKK